MIREGDNYTTDLSRRDRELLGCGVCANRRSERINTARCMYTRMTCALRRVCIVLDMGDVHCSNHLADADGHPAPQMDGGGR